MGRIGIGVNMEFIRHVLKECRGNRTAAARILGIDRSTLYRKMQRNATSDAFRDSHNKVN